jgi:hypothetical protein
LHSRSCMIYLPRELHDAKVSKERCEVRAKKIRHSLWFLGFAVTVCGCAVCTNRKRCIQK